ncbi:transposase [Parafannyhessea umbonata]|uniref:transposase n=1 Tax=Parafannyhessea umbonata TaxID=604330 RepID=UPI00359C74F0
MTFGGRRVLTRAGKRAVELYIKYGLKATAAIRELGHPSRVQFAAWHREWLETGGSLHERSRDSEAYSAEQRRAAVGHCLEHGRRNAHARRELGYPKSYQKLADWIEGLAPGERRTTEPRTFTLEQRQRAVTALVGRAGSAREIADEAGSSRCTLYKWKRKLLGEGVFDSL